MKKPSTSAGPKIWWRCAELNCGHFTLTDLSGLHVFSHEIVR